MVANSIINGPLLLLRSKESLGVAVTGSFCPWATALVSDPLRDRNCTLRRPSGADTDRRNHSCSTRAPIIESPCLLCRLAARLLRHHAWTVNEGTFEGSGVLEHEGGQDRQPEMSI